MEDIGKLIRGAWEFLLEPVIITTVLFVIWHFLVRQDVLNATARQRLTSALPDPESHTYKVLDAYGATKILPIALLLALTFLLYGADVLLHFMGSSTPGAVSSVPEYTLVHVGVSDLRTLWLRHAYLTSSDELARYAVYSIESIKNREPKLLEVIRARQLDESDGHYASLLELTKGVVAFSVLVAFLAVARGQSVRKVAGRLVLIFVLSFGTGVYLVAKEIYAIEQRGFADLAILRADLFNESKAGLPEHSLSPDREKELKLLEERADRQWWGIRWGDAHFVQWISRGFSEIPK